MHDINWWLMAAGFLLGLLLTFAFMIRRVEREVPVSAVMGRGTASAAERVGGHEPYGAGSARVGAGGSGPAGWTVKGNEESMLYHTHDSPNYNRIVHDVWFRDEESAQRAGFTHWGEGRATGPYGAGSAKAATDGSGPAGWTVKGNEDSMLYHTPDSPNYKQTIAEVWFRNEESAQRAGFTHWGKGRQN
jgi:uncharacterized membrane protein ArfC